MHRGQDSRNNQTIRVAPPGGRGGRVSDSQGAKPKGPKGPKGPQAPSHRQLRVGEEVRHRLAPLMQRFQPSLDAPEEISVTVTEVRMSADLRHATVFVAPFQGQDAAFQKVVIKTLQARAAFVQHQIAPHITFKFVPRLVFRLDDSSAYAQRIEALLQEARRRDGRDEEPLP